MIFSAKRSLPSKVIRHFSQEKTLLGLILIRFEQSLIELDNAIG